MSKENFKNILLGICLLVIPVLSWYIYSQYKLFQERSILLKRSLEIVQSRNDLFEHQFEQIIKFDNLNNRDSLYIQNEILEMNLKIVKNLSKIAENNIDKRLSIEIQRFDSISSKMQMITYCGNKYDENFVSYYIPLQTKYIEGKNLTINLDLNHRVYYKFKEWHCVGFDSLALNQIGERTYTFNLDVPELPKGAKSGIYKKKFDFYLKDLSSNQRDTIFALIKFKIIKDLIN